MNVSDGNEDRCDISEAISDEVIHEEGTTGSEI